MTTDLHPGCAGADCSAAYFSFALPRIWSTPSRVGYSGGLPVARSQSAHTRRETSHSSAACACVILSRSRCIFSPRANSSRVSDFPVFFTWVLDSDLGPGRCLRAARPRIHDFSNRGFELSETDLAVSFSEFFDGHRDIHVSTGIRFTIDDLGDNHRKIKDAIRVSGNVSAVVAWPLDIDSPLIAIAHIFEDRSGDAINVFFGDFRDEDFLDFGDHFLDSVYLVLSQRFIRVNGCNVHFLHIVRNNKICRKCIFISVAGKPSFGQWNAASEAQPKEKL